MRQWIVLPASAQPMGYAIGHAIELRGLRMGRYEQRAGKSKRKLRVRDARFGRNVYGTLGLGYIGIGTGGLFAAFVPRNMVRRLRGYPARTGLRVTPDFRFGEVVGR